MSRAVYSSVSFISRDIPVLNIPGYYPGISFLKKIRYLTPLGSVQTVF